MKKKLLHIMMGPASLSLLLVSFFVTSCKRDKDAAVVPDPVAIFEAPAAVKALEEATFVNKSTHADTCIWLVDGAAVPAAALTVEGNLKHKFMTAGNHEVKLTARREDKQHTVSKSIVIDPPPAPTVGFDWSFIHQQLLLPQVKFTDKSSFATEWKWTIQGYGQQSAEQHPVLTFYNINKPFNVKLRAINATTFQEGVVTINIPDDSRHLAAYTFPAHNVREDFTGHGRTGLGTKLPSSGAGVHGKSTSGVFAGSAENLMAVPGHTLTNAFAANKKMAISLWVKVTNPAVPGAILGFTSSSLDAHWCLIFNANNKLYARFPGGDNRPLLPSLNNIAADTWYHVVLNGDGVNEKTDFYLNGQLQGSLNLAIDFAHMPLTWLGWCRTERQVGISGGNDYKYLDGNLAAVRFFSGLLTQEEMEVLYHEFD